MEKPQGRTAPSNAKTPNPAKVFISWKSKDKAFVYYKKGQDGAEGTNMSMPTPLVFIPLAKAITLRGYNQKREKSYISNEVPDISTHPFIVKSYLKVKTPPTIELHGLYSTFNKTMDDSIKYTESLYAAVKSKSGEWQVVNFQLNGAALTHWFEFVKKNNIWAGAVLFDGTMTLEKNGSVDYNAPVYKSTTITPEDDAKAGELQAEVNAFLNRYYADNLELYQAQYGGSTPAPATNQSAPAIPPAQNTQRNQAPEAPGAAFGNPFDNDDDIPF